MAEWLITAPVAQRIEPPVSTRLVGGSSPSGRAGVGTVVPELSRASPGTCVVLSSQVPGLNAAAKAEHDDLEDADRGVEFEERLSGRALNVEGRDEHGVVRIPRINSRLERRGRPARSDDPWSSDE